MSTSGYNLTCLKRTGAKLNYIKYSPLLQLKKLKV